MQRREHARYNIWFPVQVDSEELHDAMAVNHDIGAGGMLIALSAELKVGEDVTVTFRLPPEGREERRIRGTILRIEHNPEDPDGVWPFRMAVAFDTVSPDLVPLLEKAASAVHDM